jgi:predicted regulator of Ras-like GTPase activity (Roadblock/LC7/MglB family)
VEHKDEQDKHFGGKEMALYTDIDDAITAALTATVAQAASMNPDGPIMDLDGNLKLVKLKFQEAEVLMKEIDKVTSAAGGADSTLQTKVTAVLNAF